MNLRSLLLAALAASSPAAVLATPDGVPHGEQFNQRAQVTVEPDVSYIFFRTPARVPIQFIREAGAEERASYETDRAIAYERARARYERALTRYQRDEELCRRRPEPFCRTRPPERPAEVNQQTFAYPPIEAVNLLSVGGSRVFERSETEVAYLIAVRPGYYSLYGNIEVTGSGPVGVCLCMGSVRFEAPAGRIVDLGTINSPDFAEDDNRASRRMNSQQVVPAAAGAMLPARLAGLPVVPAELRAAGKVPNFFAVEIDRHPPIDGVLAYDRDRVIDLRAESAPAAGGSN